MSKTELIDDHVSTAQCEKAVHVLLAHALKVQEKKAENELLPDKEQNVWLVVTTKQMHPEKKLKPSKIPLAHPLVDPRTSPVCLITKDPQREYKDLLESHNIRFISRVVGITKLKGKFKPFEARRLLLKENGLFLADDRVVPLLPKLLGKAFFKAKKQPIPVCLTRKDLKGELERAISSTYFHQNQGTCVSVKIGTLSQNPTQVLDNLKTALPAIAKNVNGAWDNIQSLYVKTNSSTSLPVWTCKLGSEEGGRWDGLIARESNDESDEEHSEDDAAVAVKKSVQAEGKKRKREVEEPAAESKTKEKAKTQKEVANRDGKKKRASKEEVEKPKKKAKVDESGADEKAEVVKEKEGQKDKGKGKKRAVEETEQPPKKQKAGVERAGAAVEGKPERQKAKSLTDLPKDAPALKPSPPDADNAVSKPKSKKAATSQPAEVTEVLAASKKAAKRKTHPEETKAPTSTAASHATESSAPNKEELKQKREAEGLEKKKAKVADGKPGGKSAKAAVLGKRKA